MNVIPAIINAKKALTRQPVLLKFVGSSLFFKRVKATKNTMIGKINGESPNKTGGIISGLE